MHIYSHLMSKYQLTTNWKIDLIVLVNIYAKPIPEAFPTVFDNHHSDAPGLTYCAFIHQNRSIRLVLS